MAQLIFTIHHFSCKELKHTELIFASWIFFLLGLDNWVKFALLKSPVPLGVRGRALGVVNKHGASFQSIIFP